MSVAIIVRGHERGATAGDGLYLALTRLCELLPDPPSLFVRSWLHEDAPTGSTWRPAIPGQFIASRHTLNQSRVCAYFDRGVLKARLETCVLETEPRGALRSMQQKVFGAPVAGQVRMWSQQMRALAALEARRFDAAVSLRFDVFVPAFLRANGFDREHGVMWEPVALGDGLARSVLARHRGQDCMHTLGGCATAIGADNVLLGALGAMRTLIGHMLRLYMHTPAANLTRDFHRAKPHHEYIVPWETRRLGLCCDLEPPATLYDGRPSFGVAPGGGRAGRPPHAHLHSPRPARLVATPIAQRRRAEPQPGRSALPHLPLALLALPRATNGSTRRRVIGRKGGRTP